MTTAKPADKAVAAAWESLDVARVVGGIVEGFAKLIHGGVQAVIEVHKSIGGPDTGAQLLAGDHPAGALQERGKNLEGLAAQFELDPALPQLASEQIGFEGAELAEFVARFAGIRHSIPECITGIDGGNGEIVP